MFGNTEIIEEYITQTKPYKVDKKNSKNNLRMDNHIENLKKEEENLFGNTKIIDSYISRNEYNGNNYSSKLEIFLRLRSPLLLFSSSYFPIYVQPQSQTTTIISTQTFSHERRLSQF